MKPSLFFGPGKKQQVLMSKGNGELVIGVPLFLGWGEIVPGAYSADHVGYALFHNDEFLDFFTNEQVSLLPFEWLGDL